MILTYTHVHQQLDTEAKETAVYNAKNDRPITIGKGKGITIVVKADFCFSSNTRAISCAL